MTAGHEPPLYADVDILVVGSGSAGSTAAIAAGRAGADVLLVERNAFLGGTSTAVLDTFYGFYTPGERPRKVVGGVGDDVVEGLRALGPVVLRPNSFGAGTGVTYHPDHLKVVWEDLVEQAGVRVLLNATVQQAVVDDGAVQEVTLATKAGLRRVRARCYVDASGDADLVHFAGFGYETAGATEPAQTLTTTFKMVGVDTARRATISKAELQRLMTAAAESGEYALPRREGSDHITPVDGMTATIMTRLDSYEKHGDRFVDATDPDFLTRAEIDGRKQALTYVRFLRAEVPGYENAQLASFSTQIGVRETRRVYGDYRLTRDDVLAARQFDDQVGMCGAPIEDHHSGSDTSWTFLADGDAVGIPYRTLLVRDATNTLVAGRCFSATHDAHAAVRSMAQCMAMGQAAGTAAALACKGNTTLRDLDVDELQRHLRQDGAIVVPADTRPAPATS